MKIVARILLVLVALLAIISFFGNRLISRAAIKAVEDSTGFKVRFDKVDVGIMRPVVQIENMILTNPPDFPHDEALQVKEFYVRYNRLSLLTRHIHLYELILDVPRVVMVKPESGDSNIEILSKMGKREEKPASKPSEKPADQKKTDGAGETGHKAEEKPPYVISVDKLNVKFGEMEVRSYRRKNEEPAIMNVPVHLDQTYNNVTNIHDIATQLTSALLIKSGIGFLNQLHGKMKKEDGKPDKVSEEVRKGIQTIKSLFKD
jgi:uncharacterized protein involved in outer membrane biogenesis